MRTSILPRRSENPAVVLENSIGRLIDDFFSGTPMSLLDDERMTGYLPRIDVSETDKEVRISAELPGMEEKDIDLSVVRDTLILKGEKKAEEKEEKAGYTRVERQWGSFERHVAIPEEVDPEKIEATFKNGVLNVVLPKTRQPGPDHKKISIKKTH